MCGDLDTKNMPLGPYLKPCPFCGGKAELMEDLLLVWVACTKCATSSPEATDPEYAAKLWNTRYGESAAYNVGFIDCCEYADHIAGFNQEKQALVTALFARAKECRKN